MKEIGFPEQGAHAIKHNELKEQVKWYQREIYQKNEVTPNEVLEFLRNWLVNHIIYMDMKIANYLKEKRRRKPVSIEGGHPNQK